MSMSIVILYASMAMFLLGLWSIQVLAWHLKFPIEIIDMIGTFVRPLESAAWALMWLGLIVDCLVAAPVTVWAFVAITFWSLGVALEVFRSYKQFKQLKQIAGNGKQN